MRVWAGVGVPGCAGGFMGVCRCAWVWEWAEGGLRGCAWVYACVWDEFSEFLLENRVPTSADFNTYPIRIFFHSFGFFIYVQNKLLYRGSSTYANFVSMAYCIT